MSQNEKNSRMISDMDFSALDRELARMAAETPPVPADFHAGWVRMVREDAAARTEGKPAEKASENRRRQWRHLASAAAVFVLLIGGVILAWNNRKNGDPPSGGKTASGNIQQVSEADINTAADPEEYEQADGEELLALGDEPMTDDSYEIAREEYAEAEESAMAEPAMAEAAMAEPAMEEAAMSAQAANDETAMKAADVPEDADAVGEANAGAMFFAMADEGADRAGAEPQATNAMAAGSSAQMASAEVYATPAVTEEAKAENGISESSEKAAAPEADQGAASGKQQILPEENSVEEGDHSFLQRVWTWLLTAAPWALGAVMVILFIASVVIHFGKKNS